MFECWWILPAVQLLLLPWLKDWYRLIKQVFNSWNPQKKQWIQSSIASIQRNQGCHRSWPISRLSAQNRFSPDERNTKNGLSANPSLVFMHQSSEVWNKTNWMTNSSWYLECESHCVIWIHIYSHKKSHLRDLREVWKSGSVEVIIGISQSYKFCWMSLGILISWNQEDK